MIKLSRGKVDTSEHIETAWIFDPGVNLTETIKQRGNIRRYQSAPGRLDLLVMNVPGPTLWTLRPLLESEVEAIELRVHALIKPGGHQREKRKQTLRHFLMFREGVVSARHIFQRGDFFGRDALEVSRGSDDVHDLGGKSILDVVPHEARSWLGSVVHGLTVGFAEILDDPAKEEPGGESVESDESRPTTEGADAGK